MATKVNESSGAFLMLLHCRHRRGRLIIERTAGKDYTTLADIERMRGLCRVKVEAHISGCIPRDAMKPAASRTPPSGTSRMVDFARARSALNTTLQELSARFRQYLDRKHQVAAKHERDPAQIAITDVLALYAE
jgi:hypothetical protein